MTHERDPDDRALSYPLGHKGGPEHDHALPDAVDIPVVESSYELMPDGVVLDPSDEPVFDLSDGAHLPSFPRDSDSQHPAIGVDIPVGSDDAVFEMFDDLHDRIDQERADG